MRKKRVTFVYIIETVLILIAVVMIFLLAGCAEEDGGAGEKEAARGIRETQTALKEDGGTLGKTGATADEALDVKPEASNAEEPKTQTPEAAVPKTDAPKTEGASGGGTAAAEGSVNVETMSAEEQMALLTERMPYYRESAYYDEMLRYWEQVRGVTDVSYRMYPLYETDNIYLTKEELADEPATVIHLAKNEIYARHGYIFRNEDLYNYFMGCIWYMPTTAPEDFSDAVFNEYEKANLELLTELEKGEAITKLYYGKWKVVDFRAPGITALSTEEMEGYMDLQLTYTEKSFTVGDLSVENPIYSEETITKEDFADGYNSQVTFDNLDISAASVTDVSIVNSFTFGSMFYAVDENTLYVTMDGAFFKAVRQTE